MKVIILKQGRLDSRASFYFHTKSKLTLSCLLVMSYPADGIESTYKNNIDDVRGFLEAKYAENYLVINVSPRTYRTEKLSNRVCDRL